MQRGLILTISQVLVVMVILQSATLINTNAKMHLLEMETAEKIKDFEMISYNIMFDLCLNLKKWVSEMDGSAENREIEVEGRLIGWITEVEEYFGRESNIQVIVSGIEVVEYKGQACDIVQMAFIGKENLTGWYVSGIMSVDLEWLFVKSHKVFRINIAV